MTSSASQLTASPWFSQTEPPCDEPELGVRVVEIKAGVCSPRDEPGGLRQRVRAARPLGTDRPLRSCIALRTLRPGVALRPLCAGVALRSLRPGIALEALRAGVALNALRARRALRARVALRALRTHEPAGTGVWLAAPVSPFAPFAPAAPAGPLCPRRCAIPLQSLRWQSDGPGDRLPMRPPASAATPGDEHG